MKNSMALAKLLARLQEKTAREGARHRIRDHPQGRGAMRDRFIRSSLIAPQEVGGVTNGVGRMILVEVGSRMKRRVTRTHHS